MPNDLVIYGDPEELKVKELRKFLNSYSSMNVRLNPQVQSVKSSIVYITGFNRTFLNLNHSNKIIFLKDSGELSSQDLLLMPKISAIIAPTQYEANKTCWALKRRGLKTRVINLLPWFRKELISKGDIYCPNQGEFKNALLNHVIQSANPKAPILMCLTKEKTIPNYLIQGMASGAICIALDSPPFNEIIIHGHNGYLVRDQGDFVDIFKHLEKNQGWVSHSARSYMESYFNPTRYLKALMYPELLGNLNQFDKIPLERSERTWLIRERNFANGKISYFPKSYDKNLTVIDLNSVEEVLSYFSTQEFNHVYIFGCELPDEVENKDELIRLTIKLGKRARRLHFCRDEEIPMVWKRIFENLSHVSVAEGLKQIAE